MISFFDKRTLVGILVWILSVTFAHGQVQVQDIPDQTIGLGGDFSDINLAAYSVGEEVIWEVGFSIPETPTPAPNWSVTGTDYQFEMNITAVVASKGFVASGDSHLLAIMDEEENIRGVASAIEVGDNWVYFLTVYGNTAGTSLQFVFYDATYDEQLRGGQIAFNPNAVLGQPDDPYQVQAEIVALSLENDVLSIELTDHAFLGTEYVELVARGVYNPDDVYRETIALSVIDDYEPILEAIPDQVIAFGSSFENINLGDFTTLEDMDAVTYAATTKDNLMVKIDEQTSVAQITYPDGWSGSEVVTFTVTDQTAEQFTTSRDVSFTVRPEEIAPAVTGLEDQTIGTGGTPETINLNDFVTTNNPEGIVWNFSVFNESGSGAPDWQVNPSAFEFSMTMTCQIQSYGHEVTGTSHLLGAFAQEDSALIGVAEAIEVGEDWLFFLTVYSNEADIGIYFQLYDGQYDKVINVQEVETFVSNAVIGDPIEPVTMRAGYIAPRISDGVVSFEMLDDSWSGTEQFVFVATDTTTVDQLSGQDMMTIEVIDIQSPTLAMIPTQEIYEGENFGPVNLVDFLGGVAEEQVTFTISGADTLSPTLSNNRVNVTLPDEDYFGEATLTVTATHNDFPNLIASRKITYRVENVNDAPTFHGAEPLTRIPVGELYRYEIDGQDIDNALLELTVSGNPDWMVFVKNGGFGLFFGTPDESDEGIYSIHLELTDGQATVTKDFIIEVVNSYARFIEPSAQIINEGESFQPFDLSGITEKTADVTVAYVVESGGELMATISGTNLEVSVPNEDWFGSETFTITLLDAGGAEPVEIDQVNITYEVLNVNDAPSIQTTVLPNVGIGASYSQNIQVLDIDSDAFTYTLDGQPDWLQLAETKTGLLLYGTPSEANRGDVNLTVEVSDGALSDSRIYSFSVSNSYAVLVDGKTVSISEGSTFDAFDLTTITSKTDDYSVRYVISGGVELSSVLSGAELSVSVPDSDWFGVEQLTIQLIDQSNDAVLDETVIAFEVTNVNDAPVINTSAIENIKVLEALDVLLEVSDIDSKEFDYSLAGNPSWMSSAATPKGLLLYGRPSGDDHGSVSLTFEVSDGELTATQAYSFEVENSYARLTGPSSQVINEGEEFEILDLATITNKTDDFNVAYAVVGGSSLMPAIDGSELSVTIPDADWFGMETFTLQLLNTVDDHAVLDEVEITYEVVDVNDVPVIVTTTLADAGREVAYSQTIEVEDMEGDSLGYRLLGAPEWINYSTTTTGLLLFGVPDRQDVGSKKFTLEVNDGIDTISLEYTLKINNKVIAGLEHHTLKVYPNPVADVVNIAADHAIIRVALVTLSGQEVHRFDSSNQQDMQLDVTDLAEGVYVLEVITTKNHSYQQLIIQH